jgi:uncharacterized repeat protein (TIGR01451 family)
MSTSTHRTLLKKFAHAIAATALGSGLLVGLTAATVLSTSSPVSASNPIQSADCAFGSITSNPLVSNQVQRSTLVPFMALNGADVTPGTTQISVVCTGLPSTDYDNGMLVGIASPIAAFNDHLTGYGLFATQEFMGGGPDTPTSDNVGMLGAQTSGGDSQTTVLSSAVSAGATSLPLGTYSDSLGDGIGLPGNIPSGTQLFVGTVGGVNETVTTTAPYTAGDASISVTATSNAYASGQSVIQPYLYTIPSTGAYDTDATCPPTQAQVNLGLTNCAMAVADTAANEFGFAYVNYPTTTTWPASTTIPGTTALTNPPDLVVNNLTNPSEGSAAAPGDTVQLTSIGGSPAITDLNAASSAGATSLTVTPLPSALPSGYSLVIGPSSGTHETVTLSAAATAGATTISVTALVNAYSKGSPVSPSGFTVPTCASLSLSAGCGIFWADPDGSLSEPLAVEVVDSAGTEAVLSTTNTLGSGSPPNNLSIVPVVYYPSPCTIANPTLCSPNAPTYGSGGSLTGGVLQAQGAVGANQSDIGAALTETIPAEGFNPTTGAATPWTRGPFTYAVVEPNVAPAGDSPFDTTSQSCTNICPIPGSTPITQIAALTAASSAGATSLSVSPMPAALPAGYPLAIGSTGGTHEAVFLTSPVVAGATSISVTPTVNAYSPGAAVSSTALPDPLGAAGTATGTIQPALLSIITTSLPGGTSGVAYSATLAATGGTTPYTWSVISGSLPGGLNLNASTGVISGTPEVAFPVGTTLNASPGVIVDCGTSTLASTSNFTVQVTDSSNPAQIATKALSITVSGPPSITPTCLPEGTVGIPYSQTLTFTGETITPYTWSVTTGTLPAGLGLDASTGVISGTPTTAGTSSFTVQVTDSSSPTQTSTAALSITIVAPLAITTTSLPGGTVGTAYSATLAATGGTTPYTWSVSSGSLPMGLTLNASTGVISGTPTINGTSSFTVMATDSSSPPLTTTQALSIFISVTLPLAITTTSVPGGQVGTAYSATLTAFSVNPPDTWSVSVGSLPPGLTLNASTGVIFGTPTTVGTFSFTVAVTDSHNPPITATANLSIVVISGLPLSITTTSLPGGTVGTAYSATLAATGGTTPYTWAVTSGSLPAGLTLSSAYGVISGTPTTVGTSSFTVAVTDSESPAKTATASLSIVISAAVVPLSITTTSLPGGQTGTAYSATLAATGGTPPYTWSVSAGSLPAELTLAASTGVISGTPTTVGTSSFTVAVHDSSTPTEMTGTVALSITIVAPVSITTTSLPGGTVGTAYSATLAATGGTTPYTWAVTSGSLPAGLTLSSAYGVISGTPTTVDTSSFTVAVTDSSTPTEMTGTVALSITIVAPVSITTTSLPGGTVGTAYSATLAATGGTTPYTWAVTSGSLPAGLTLSSAYGVISGTPTTVGTSSFTVAVTDSESPAKTATASLSIVVAPVAIAPPVARADHYYTPVDTKLTVGAPGVLGNDTLNGATIVPHTNPAHGTLTLSANGSFTYSPAFLFVGIDSFTYTLKNTSGSSTATVTIDVPARADLSVTVSAPSSAKTGSSFTYTVKLTNNGPDPASGIVTAFYVPSGLKVTSVSSGARQGLGLYTWSVTTLAPSASLTFTVTVQVTARAGSTLSATAATVGSSLDPNLLNNVATASTKVTSS